MEIAMKVKQDVCDCDQEGMWAGNWNMACKRTGCDARVVTV